MNIFFYAATGSPCTDRCEYRTCSRKCLSLFVDLPFFPNLRVLPDGSGITTPVSMDLRSGDLIILYAADQRDLERLLAIRTFLDAFRVLLVVGDENVLANGMHFNLNPRYTITLGRNMVKLGAVIERMTAGVEHQASGSRQRQQVQDHA